MTQKPNSPATTEEPATYGLDDPNGLIRSRLDREDELLMQRTTWLVNSQAFLFTGYAITLNGLCSPAPSAVVHQIARLNLLLPWASLTCLVLLYVSMLAGMLTSLRMRRHLRPCSQTKATEASLAARLLGLAGPLLIPPVFLLTWISLLSGLF